MRLQLLSQGIKINRPTNPTNLYHALGAAESCFDRICAFLEHSFTKVHLSVSRGARTSNIGNPGVYLPVLAFPPRAAS
eukprot:972236-Pelagomonas_calceolata.AAC.1